MVVMIKLSDIIDNMEFQPGESTAYLNRETGEVATIPDEAFQAVENGESLDDFSEWQQGAIKTAGEIPESEDYIPLPTKFDIHEYAIMERYCLSIPDDKLSDRLYRSIKKRGGAVKRFKDNIDRHDLAEEWYRYRRQEIKEMAIEWCEENGLSYKDE